MLHQSAYVNFATAMLPNFATMDSISTRFGTIIADTERAVTFPRGLLGMPNQKNFLLTNFPSEKMRQFLLLQSLDDEKLSFITLPTALDNPIIRAQDLNDACRDHQISEADLAAALIVSVHRGSERARLSVNARAPLLIDSRRKIGVQHVFYHDTYKVQHML